MKGQTLKLGSLRRTLEGSLKKKTAKVSYRFSFIPTIIHGCVLLGSIGVCGHAFVGFVGVPSH
jgi:hypothetical protein